MNEFFPDVTIDSEESYLKRIKSAAALKPENITGEGVNASCEFTSKSSGEIYRTTVTECSCMDYMMRGGPCKHMIALGAALGMHDLQRQAEIRAAADKLCMAYGSYYLFGRSAVTDREYRKLKEKCAPWLKEGFPVNPSTAGPLTVESIASVDDLVDYLAEQNIKFTDNRKKGGKISFRGSETTDSLVSGLKKSGITFDRIDLSGFHIWTAG